jgi:hypothetical protein
MCWHIAKTGGSIDQFHGELDLPRRAGCLADYAEPASADDVRWQSEVHGVEYIEKLGAELNGS